MLKGESVPFPRRNNDPGAVLQVNDVFYSQTSGNDESLPRFFKEKTGFSFVTDTFWKLLRRLFQVV